MKPKSTSARLRGFSALRPQPAGLAPADIAGHGHGERGPIVGALIQRWEELVRRIAVRRAVAKTSSELGRLDDRILREIGIERGQIPYVSLEAAKRRHDPWS